MDMSVLLHQSVKPGFTHFTTNAVMALSAEHIFELVKNKPAYEFIRNKAKAKQETSGHTEDDLADRASPEDEVSKSDVNFLDMELNDTQARSFSSIPPVQPTEPETITSGLLDTAQQFASEPTSLQPPQNQVRRRHLHPGKTNFGPRSRHRENSEHPEFEFELQPAPPANDNILIWQGQTFGFDFMTLKGKLSPHGTANEYVAGHNHFTSEIGKKDQMIAELTEQIGQLSQRSDSEPVQSGDDDRGEEEHRSASMDELNKLRTGRRCNKCNVM